MSIARSLIARAKPHMVAARALALVEAEAGKGCCPDIRPVAVALEPRYHAIQTSADLLGQQECSDYIPESTVLKGNLKRLQLWVSPDEAFSWLNAELFLKQIRTASHRMVFEIFGNNRKIRMGFLVHVEDLPILRTAFKAQFERCELAPMDKELSDGAFRYPTNDIMIIDCFPPPPYSHLLTRPGELKVTTYRALIAALMDIRNPAIGFYQALFQPTKAEHNWHRNIQILLDMEYTLKLASTIQGTQRYLQQAPSGDLHHMAQDVETKAHDDKPFYAVALRLGVLSAGAYAPSYLKSLSTFVSLFQHGGRSLNYLTEQDYRNFIPKANLVDMLISGTTYRPGFIANSSELAGFVHIPPADILEYRNPPLSTLETLPVKDASFSIGTPIGTCHYAGIDYPVCIPPKIRTHSTHIIGRPGHAKSTIMAHMILDDIKKETGVAVLDPHGDLIEALLCLIKENDIERSIYFDPGHPDFVPIWNPLKRSHGQDISRTADDIVAAIKNVVTGWGDRMEHLLRHGLYALLQLSNSTLLDLSDLLRRKTANSNHLKKAILEIVENQTARQFWENDFDRYSNEALDPPKHKLSKLLVSGTVSLMLSQPENFIDFRRTMDEGLVLLVNLSTIGSETRELLGCFILSLLHLTALGRSDTVLEGRKQFHVYVDEAHRFMTEAMEDLIAETRKFGVGLTLAHHYFSQFGTKKIDALSSVGTTIIMNVDGKDARFLTKDLRNLVQYEDLIDLKIGEAIVRIGTDIIRIKTVGPLHIPPHNSKQRIIEHSIQRYYKPVHVIRKAIRQRNQRWDQPYSPLTDHATTQGEEFYYDEF